MGQIKILKFIGLFTLFFFLQEGALLFAQQISYDGTGSWDRKELGNHRAVIQVDRDSDAVFVHVPWRLNPDQVSIEAPAIENFQAGREYPNLSDINIPVGKGGIIIIEKK